GPRACPERLDAGSGVRGLGPLLLCERYRTANSERRRSEQRRSEQRRSDDDPVRHLRRNRHTTAIPEIRLGHRAVPTGRADLCRSGGAGGGDPPSVQRRVFLAGVSAGGRRARGPGRSRLHGPPVCTDAGADPPVIAARPATARGRNGRGTVPEGGGAGGLVGGGGGAVGGGRRGRTGAAVAPPPPGS